MGRWRPVRESSRSEARAHRSTDPLMESCGRVAALRRRSSPQAGPSACLRAPLELRRKQCQVLAPLPCLLGSLGAMQAVLQFDHGHDGEHDFGFAVLVLERGEQAATGLASRSAAIRTPESSTNPMRAVSTARGERRCQLARHGRSRDRAPGHSRAFLHRPWLQRCTR